MDRAWPTFNSQVKRGKPSQDLPPLCHVRTGEQSHSIIPAITSTWQNVKYVRLPSIILACVEEAPSNTFTDTGHAAGDKDEVPNRSQTTTDSGAGGRTFLVPKRGASDDYKRR